MKNTDLKPVVVLLFISEWSNTFHNHSPSNALVDITSKDIQ